MNNVELFLGCLILILLFQIYALYKLYQSIRDLWDCYPPGSGFEAFQIKVSDELRSSLDPLELLKGALEGKYETQTGVHFLEAQSKLTLVKPAEKNENAYAAILESLNLYFISIGKARPDYQVVSGMINKQGRVCRRKIRDWYWLPIALGFLGCLTLLISGLFLYDVDGDFSLTDVFIEVLKFSLIPVATGLFFTILLHWVFLQGAQAKAREGKEALESFFRTGYFPMAGEDLSIVLKKTQENLEFFNSAFRKNITDFENAMGTINSNVVYQGEFLSKLGKLNLEEIAETNIAIFQKLDRIMGEFDRFTNLMDKLNSNVEGAIALDNRLDKLTKSAESIQLEISRVGQEIDNKLHLSNEMIRFLKTHFTEMDDRKAIITKAVINFDNFMKKSFDQLERYAMERVIAIKEIKIKEEDKLIKALESNRSGLTQLQHLSGMLEEMRNMNVLLQELIDK